MRATKLILVGSFLATPACGLIASIPTYDAVAPAAAGRFSAPPGAADGSPDALESDSSLTAVDAPALDVAQDTGVQSVPEAGPDAAPDAANDSAPDAGADAMTDATADAADAGLTCASNLLIVAVTTASPGPMSPPALAVDRDLTTRWESQWGVDPQWIYTDFAAPVFIDRVRINWQAACAADYLIQVSDDAAAWTTIGTVTGNATGSGNAPTDWSTAGRHDGHRRRGPLPARLRNLALRVAVRVFHLGDADLRRHEFGLQPVTSAAPALRREKTFLSISPAPLGFRRLLPAHYVPRRESA